MRLLAFIYLLSFSCFGQFRIYKCQVPNFTSQVYIAYISPILFREYESNGKTMLELYTHVRTWVNEFGPSGVHYLTCIKKTIDTSIDIASSLADSTTWKNSGNNNMTTPEIGNGIACASLNHIAFVTQNGINYIYVSANSRYNYPAGTCTPNYYLCDLDTLAPSSKFNETYVPELAWYSAPVTSYLDGNGYYSLFGTTYLCNNYTGVSYWKRYYDGSTNNGIAYNTYKISNDPSDYLVDIQSNKDSFGNPLIHVFYRGTSAGILKYTQFNGTNEIVITSQESIPFSSTLSNINTILRSVEFDKKSNPIIAFYEASGSFGINPPVYYAYRNGSTWESTASPTASLFKNFINNLNSNDNCFIIGEYFLYKIGNIWNIEKIPSSLGVFNMGKAYSTLINGKPYAFFFSGNGCNLDLYCYCVSSDPY